MWEYLALGRSVKRSKLKKGKTPGLDGLPAELILYTKDDIIPHLVHIAGR